MNPLTYFLVNVGETLLRMLPIRSRTGVIRVGNPGRDSPVLVTGNYHLTVQRVRKALEGLDAFLLVANARGVNVWCAATGGLFTHHDVISVLKTSGIENLVGHREVILPQLAATGIERKLIRRKTGWKPVWGPVEARDIPAFLMDRTGLTGEIGQVAFPLLRRMEMAVAWAFPISAVLGILFAIFWQQGILPAVGLTWSLSILIFLSFPLYSRWLNPRTSRVGFVLFDFGRGGIQLVIGVLLLVGLAGVGFLTGQLSWGFMGRWGLMSLGVDVLLSMDLMGSTPVYKSGLHKDRWLEVGLDEEKCRGAGFCEQVCPRNCYEVDQVRHKAARPRADLCVQCGACIVQCPFDALYFETPDGSVIPPATIRQFKLNLLGKRRVNIRGDGTHER
ncbi:MAG: HgcAB-like fusion protein [Fidelibacterota bacterium]